MYDWKLRNEINIVILFVINLDIIYEIMDCMVIWVMCYDGFKVGFGYVVINKFIGFLFYFIIFKIMKWDEI